MDFKKEVTKLLVNSISLDKEQITSLLETPPKPEMGDLAFPCFTLSKALKKAPNKIAEDLKNKIKLTPSIKEIKNFGPYLNFFMNNDKIIKSTITQILKEKECYGTKKNNKKTVLVEYPSPNTNKPLHLGHLRILSLGESMARIFSTQGNQVKKINLNNDRGIHICKSMLAYKKWGRNKQPNKKTDHFVGEYYVKFAQKTNDKLEEEAQEMLRKWEAKDPETRALWKKMNKWALDGFKETYKKFGIKFNKEYYESKTYEDGRKIVLSGLKKNLFKKREDGAVIFDLGEPLGEKVLLRSNGTTVYMTQDLHLAELKYKEYKYSESIYVVGNEQNYHFKVLFEALKQLKFKSAKGVYHLSSGMINLPDGKMKSREGTVVDADNLIEDISTLVGKEMKDRKIENKDKTTLNIALAAIKYFILKHSAHKDFTFNPKESISLEGNTGPYLLYSLVRANKILTKSRLNNKVNYKLIKEPEEISLIKKLKEYSTTLENAANNHSPHILTEYTYKLASLFNSFYEKCPVISEDKNLQNARLSLVKSYTYVLNSSLNNLGINSVKEM